MPPPIVIFCNTWNHGFAECNTNKEMPLIYRHPLPSYHCTRYQLCRGSRADVDRRFGGLVKSFVKTKKEQDSVRLGARRL